MHVWIQFFWGGDLFFSLAQISTKYKQCGTLSYFQLKQWRQECDLGIFYAGFVANTHTWIVWLALLFSLEDILASFVFALTFSWSVYIIQIMTSENAYRMHSWSECYRRCVCGLARLVIGSAVCTAGMHSWDRVHSRVVNVTLPHLPTRSHS